MHSPNNHYVPRPAVWRCARRKNASSHDDGIAPRSLQAGRIFPANGSDEYPLIAIDLNQQRRDIASGR